MSDAEHESGLREALVRGALALDRQGLNRGTSGNLSVRWGDGMLITPSGIPPRRITPESIVEIDADGDWTGPYPPSSEWPFHRGILRARPEVAAVVHTHSEYATVLACQRREIPAFHYMIAVAGGTSIRCAPWAPFGTERLARLAVDALRDRKACLLANHGMIAVGADLDAALALTLEVEVLAKQYVQLLQLGGPVLLTEAEMEDVIERFAGYGAPVEPSDRG